MVFWYPATGREVVRVCLRDCDLHLEYQGKRRRELDGTAAVAAAGDPADSAGGVQMSPP